ncbi:MAG: indolepyruvate ferredoxin oxidoreductase subunit alpha [Anaerolineae bacterium]
MPRLWGVHAGHLFCFVDAIELVEGKARISAACRGCGRCVEVCPHDAIELTTPDASFVKATIDRLEPLVDLS